jgi:hypothetical protein
MAGSRFINNDTRELRAAMNAVWNEDQKLRYDKIRAAGLQDNSHNLTRPDNREVFLPEVSRISVLHWF